MENTIDFWGMESPQALLEKYGSPLYVYNENILRKRCRELKSLISYPNFVVDYSMKANSNPALLRILREEGVEVDAVSAGEIYIAEKAGYTPDELFFVCNNVSAEEMQYALDRGIRISADSLSQLEQLGQLAPHSKVAIRVNPGVGAGHHAKVITAGKATKFGIDSHMVNEIKEICSKYDLTLSGINQHIGSLFLDDTHFLESIHALFDFCRNFPDLDFIDFGGGFGIPYRTEENRLDLKKLGASLDSFIQQFIQEYGKKVQFRIEPGRYLVAETSSLLGTAFSQKENGSTHYIGTDIGFSVLMRPILYDSYHEIEVYRNGVKVTDTEKEDVTIVGNICESGDILAKNRALPAIQQGDTICVRDAGAYGHSMSSNYNSRLRPAEVLITADGNSKLIRKRDTFENLVENYVL